MDVLIGKGNTDPCEIWVPASKSLTHRALFAAALAEGESSIICPAENEDIEATIRCLSQCGVRFEKDGDTLHVFSEGGLKIPEGTRFDCSESATTLRFLIPVLSVYGGNYELSGRGRLMKRPLSVYQDLFQANGMRFEQDEEKLIIGGRLHGGSFTIPGNISSQFISGLLFSLPLLEGDSEIRITGPYQSRSYVRMTEEMLARFGIRILDQGDLIRIPGSQRYLSTSAAAEGDYSQAAFYLVLACLRKQQITVRGIPHASLQGDARIIPLLQKMDAVIEEVTDGYRITGKEMRPLHAGFGDCPDLGPVLFAAAAAAEGTSVFTEAGKLRLKESDRIAAMEAELTKLGADFRFENDTVTITGRSDLKAADLSSHQDHRIAMALSVLAAGMEEDIRIAGADCVRKSAPGFFRDLQKCGVPVTYMNEKEASWKVR